MSDNELIETACELIAYPVRVRAYDATSNKSTPALGMTAVHIYRPSGHYIGQVRKAGHRKWETVTKKCKQPHIALSAAVAKMQGHKRARVLFIDDAGYYEPNLIMEASFA